MYNLSNSSNNEKKLKQDLKKIIELAKASNNEKKLKLC